MQTRATTISMIALIAAAPATALAQNQRPGAMQEQSADRHAAMSDREFATAAAQGNLAEIEAGELAQQRSRNERVRSFGQQLQRDHQQALQRLRQAANNIRMPSEPNDDQQQRMEQLTSAGADFDRRFLAMQIEDHENTIALYERYADSGRNQALRRYAERTLPALENHLRTAQNLQRGSDTTAQNTTRTRSMAQERSGDGQAPVVTVRQFPPDVNVTQNQPHITVRQGPPRISVEVPQPEIIVRMPEPDVNVSRSRPEVSVNMPQPRVQLSQQDRSNVEIQRAQQRPQVTYESTGQPQVTYRRAQGQPRVSYVDANGQRMGDDRTQANRTGAMAQQNAGDDSPLANPRADSWVDPERTGSTPVEQNAQRDTAQARGAQTGDGATNAGAARRQFQVGDLMDSSIYNGEGDNVGEIDRVVMNTDDNRPYIILASGGFLGMFEDQVALPLDRVRYQNGRLTVTGLTEEEIGDMENWRERVPNWRMLGASETAAVSTGAMANR